MFRRFVFTLVFVAGLSFAEGPAVPPAYREGVVAPTGWTAAKAKLGKRLFGEPMLSSDGSVPCASCHEPSRAFTDGRRFGVGVRGRHGTRSTPTVVNRALGSMQFWDGRAKTLEEQALIPIANPAEMNLPIPEAVSRLQKDRGYRAAFKDAFGTETVTAARLGEALGAYQRTIFSVDAPYDRFVSGDDTALGDPERRGLSLFFGKAGCSLCHSGPSFTDEAFHVIGVARDEGRRKVTGRSEDLGALKTPTLREISRTAPYFHDGSAETLEEVVDLFDRGGEPHPNLSKRLRPLGLSASEKTELIAFLKTLSGRIVDFGGELSVAREVP